ncbi:MAG: cytochrome c [candidate division KSB1 bacterium]|nr:cytochrome c [candidate division KSB1 bacterium]
MKSPMVNLLKWTAIALGSLAGLVLIALAVIYLISSNRMQRSYSVPSHPVAALSDSSVIAYGKRLSQIRGCTDCHGENLAGRLVIDAPLVMKLYSSNLTPGKGGIGKTYSDADWERSIRHGVRPNGKPLLFMPTLELIHLSDGDVAALIAYLKTLPPVDRVMPASTVGPLGRVLYLAGEIPLVHAELVDHVAGHPDAPTPGITVEYGQYLAPGCMGCHGPHLTGGKIPGAPPDWPLAANLTPSGNLKDWDEAGFIQAMRTGIKPNGQPFQPQMPYQTLKAMTDEELKAIWLFLQSLPANTGLTNAAASTEP